MPPHPASDVFLYSLKRVTSEGLGYISVAGHLSSVHNALGSIPGTRKLKSKGYLSKSVVRESTVQTPDIAVVT